MFSDGKKEQLHPIEIDHELISLVWDLQELVQQFRCTGRLLRDLLVVITTGLASVSRR
jgi:hypothetical protein